MPLSSKITRKSKSNLAPALLLLPKEKRQAARTLYAFCRVIDDIADDKNATNAEKNQTLELWRQDLLRIYSNLVPRFELTKELSRVVTRFNLPRQLFEELFRGIQMDIEKNRYATMEELEDYCYCVASVPGLLSIEIFGYTHPNSKQYAIYLGKALQLTNILRDVKTDAQRNRIYLPQSELSTFEVTEEEVLNGVYSERFYRLAAHLANRAKEFFRRASESLPQQDRPNMIAAELMGAVYRMLLEKLEHTRFDVFNHPKPQIPAPTKFYLLSAAVLHKVLGTPMPKYAK